MEHKNALQVALKGAIVGYDFPRVTFDFKTEKEIRHAAMQGVEVFIRNLLIADDSEKIKDGFANVLYWGYARTGYRWRRIQDFRDRVTNQQLLQAKAILQSISGSALRQIANLHLPQFSGVSFISKTRMFLDPENYVVLDTQLLKLRNSARANIFHTVRWNGGTIRPSRKNQACYEQWCYKCKRIAKDMVETDYRAVDVERGIFYLVQSDRLDLAAEIITTL